MKPIADAKKAEAYYAVTDGGYYVEGGLRREWGGKAAPMLGLSGDPDYEHFKNLINGLDPHTGEQLTAKLIPGRIPAWDVTASVPKGVTVALECGDERIQAMIWEAVHEAMARLEEYATTRVRVDGQQADRRTGNLVWYAVEHADTRPVEDEAFPEDHRWRFMPQPDRHIHCVIPNLTFDDVEGKWKAVKFRPIMDLRRFFDRTFDSMLASKLADLGYEVETKWKSDGKGGNRYFTWDIVGMPSEVTERFSKRSKEVDEAEAEILEAMKEENGTAPERLSAVVRDQLGATSRRQKRDDLTLEECREYWKACINPEESDAIDDAIAKARGGLNPRPEKRASAALDFAIRHHAEKESVFRWEELAATALEHSIGSSTLRDIEQAAKRCGLIVLEIDGRTMVTTEELQREEDFIAGIASGGRGEVEPVGIASELSRAMSDGKRLNDGQWEAVIGLLQSSNRVNLVEGPAGAGKSSLLAKLDEGLRAAGQHVTYLATTSAATGVLQRDGFNEAATVARFLVDEELQKSAAGSRVVIDESSMLGHADAVKLYTLAQKLDLKLIHVGDPMQHGAVTRGAFLHVLKEYGHIKPFKLTQILRQESPEYRAATAKLSEGKTAEGFNALDALGWVKEMKGAERYKAMAAEFVASWEELKQVKESDRVLCVSPTHAEAALITTEIRSRLREAGKLGEEQKLTRLVAVDASEAERGLATTYQVGDVLQFHQNAKGYKKGQRVVVTDPAQVPVSQSARFSIYRPQAISLAVGDRVRFTGTVNTLDGKHTLRNGAAHTVAGFTAKGIRLDNGWLVSKTAGHIRHGFVETSFGSQGRTVRRVILGMSSASMPATNQEQMYVSSSRAKERLSLYTDEKEEVRQAILRTSRKLAALDLRPKPRPDWNRDRVREFMEDRRRQAHRKWFLSHWDTPRQPSPTPPLAPGPPSGLTHAERVRQERSFEHER